MSVGCEQSTFMHGSGASSHMALLQTCPVAAQSVRVSTAEKSHIPVIGSQVPSPE